MSGWAVAALVVTAPVALFALLMATARLESRMVAPDERAEAVSRALARPEGPDAVEQLVAELVEQALPPGGVARPEPAKPQASAVHGAAPRPPGWRRILPRRALPSRPRRAML